MNTIKANSRILNNLEGESTVSQNEQLFKRKENYFQKENFRLNHSHEYNYVSTKL